MYYLHFQDKMLVVIVGAADIHHGNFTIPVNRQHFLFEIGNVNYRLRWIDKQVDEFNRNLFFLSEYSIENWIGAWMNNFSCHSPKFHATLFLEK